MNTATMEVNGSQELEWGNLEQKPERLEAEAETQDWPQEQEQQPEGEPLRPSGNLHEEIRMSQEEIERLQEELELYEIDAEDEQERRLHLVSLGQSAKDAIRAESGQPEVAAALTGAAIERRKEEIEELETELEMAEFYESFGRECSSDMADYKLMHEEILGLFEQIRKLTGQAQTKIQLLMNSTTVKDLQSIKVACERWGLNPGAFLAGRKLSKNSGGPIQFCEWLWAQSSELMQHPPTGSDATWREYVQFLMLQRRATRM